MGESTSMTLATGLTAVNSLITNAVTVATGNEIIFAMLIVPLVGAGVGLLKRFI